LGIILADQGGRIASMSPEGGVFDMMAGLYSKNGMPSFDVYLKAHSGDDLITDRVSRASVCVRRPALTCAYAIQPQVIKGLAENAAFRGRGLLARFLYSIPESWIGHRDIDPAPMSCETKEAYRQLVRSLSANFGNNGSASEPIELRFDVSASRELETWMREIENMLADGGSLEVIRDWGSKLAGATIRLAAVMHCVEDFEKSHISVDTIRAAIAIARYLIPHAEAVLEMMQATDSTENEDAIYVLKWIERHERREFTKSEAQHHGKRKFPKAEDIDAPLSELVRRGYIRVRPLATFRPGRPPSPLYEVNPAVFENGRSQKRSHNSRNSMIGQAPCDSGNNGSAIDGQSNHRRVQVSV
jgi:hypothetical protein